MNYKIFILKQQLLEVINNSGLPIFVVELLLKDILKDIDDILIEQIQLELNADENSTKEFNIQINNNESKTINFEEEDSNE